MTDYVQKAMNGLENEKRIVIDVETSGLDWRKNYIIGYVFNFGPSLDQSFYLPVRHSAGANLFDHPGLNSPECKNPTPHHIEYVIRDALSHRTDPFEIIGHNLQFDLRMMHKHGIKISPYARLIDTQVDAALLNEFARSYSLDACAKREGVTPKLGEELYHHLANLFGGAPNKGQMSNLWLTRGDDPTVVDYSIGDGICTYELHVKQQQRIKEEDLSKVADIEHRLTRTLHRLTMRGIKVDQDRLVSVEEEVNKQYKKAVSVLPENFNSKSPIQVKNLLESKGITDWPYTQKGSPSFPESYLKKFEIGRNIVAVRKYAHLHSSFIEPLKNKHLYRGRVHPEFHQLRDDDYGTITGRLSSSNPNMQQIHKRNEELSKLFRSVFVPDEGMWWRTIDWSQCEPRLLAFYSRCKILLNGYTADPPVDAHDSVSKAANIDRESGKRLNQSLITGAGRVKIRAMLADSGINPDEADRIIDNYFQAMPEVKSLQKKAARRMQERGYVRSLLGRKARLENDNFAYKAMNRLLQCGNADMIKLKMVEIDEFLESEGDRVHMLNNVHDALDFQYFTADQLIMNCAQEMMRSFGENDLIHLDVPIEVDAGDGLNWSEATWSDK